MANRDCPVCRKVVPAIYVGPFTNGFDCPHCQSRLEVSAGSRYLSSWAGLAVGYGVWQLSKGSGGTLNFVLPVLYSVLAFGAVAWAVAVFTVQLSVAEAPPAAPPPPAAHGHH